MKAYLVSIVFLLLISSCTEKSVTITKDFVINPNWKKEFNDGNTLAVYKMKLKDSSKTIDLKNPTEPELYHGLVKDTSLAYSANVKFNGTDYSKRKVYFNKDNGFLWCDLNNMHSNCERRILGELEQDTWYLLTGLSQISALYYVHIDPLDSLRVFKVSTMTNY